jgi:hypothetical protein
MSKEESTPGVIVTDEGGFTKGVFTGWEDITPQDTIGGGKQDPGAEDIEWHGESDDEGDEP